MRHFEIHETCLLVTKVFLKSFTSERPLECLSPKCPAWGGKRGEVVVLVPQLCLWQKLISLFANMSHPNMQSSPNAKFTFSLFA